MSEYEVKTETIYASNDAEYDRKLNYCCVDGWEPFASEYEQDGRYKVRMKRIVDGERTYSDVDLYG